MERGASRRQEGKGRVAVVRTETRVVVSSWREVSFGPASSNVARWTCSGNCSYSRQPAHPMSIPQISLTMRVRWWHRPTRLKPMRTCPASRAPYSPGAGTNERARSGNGSQWYAYIQGWHRSHALHVSHRPPGLARSSAFNELHRVQCVLSLACAGVTTVSWAMAARSPTQCRRGCDDSLSRKGVVYIKCQICAFV